MTIEEFKTLTTDKKLAAIKYDGNILGPYERTEENGSKMPGDIYELFQFWVYLSEDEKLIIPTRRNPIEQLEQ